jgi:hypothetical protein
MIWADQMREHGHRDDNGRTAKNDRGDGVGQTATQKPATRKISAKQQRKNRPHRRYRPNSKTGTRQQKQETARKVTRLVMTMK